MMTADPKMAALDEALAAWAQRRLGFDRRALRFERLRATAEREARRAGWAALEQFLKDGRTDAAMDTALVASATVGETYFFRQREHFDLLANLPFRGSPQAPLRVWSAACASGEEAYSLAVALRENLGLQDPAVRVWGTDINELALESARQASYGRWSFRANAIEDRPVDSAFEAAEAEALRAKILHPATRAVVRFARQNLLEAPTFDGEQGGFHLIFCRNALVYFEPQAAARAVAHLVDALLPGGWLVLGNMDIAHTPLGTRREGSAHLCVFEKIDAPAPQAPVVVTAPKMEIEPRPAPKPVPKAPVVPSSIAAPVADEALAEDWHRGILAQLEAGEDDAALLELQALVEAQPLYLPGWFEHGLALNRAGQKDLAAQSLRRVQELSKGLDPAMTVGGPEPLSLEFYLSNAQAFLQSLGDGR